MMFKTISKTIQDQNTDADFESNVKTNTLETESFKTIKT